MLNLAFHDLTPKSYNLNPLIHKLLGLNSKFCPTPRSLEPNFYSSALNDLLRSIRIRYMFKNKIDRPFNKYLYVKNSSFSPNAAPKIIEDHFEKLKRLNVFGNVNRKKIKHNLPLALRRLITELKMNKEIQVTNTDKNLGPAILLKSHYLELCNKHLNNKESYCLMEGYQLKSLLNLIENTAEKIKKFGGLETKIITNELQSCKFSRFYMLPKIHKVDHYGKWKNDMRPIVSSINSPTYGLSKWLSYFLQEYVNMIPSYIKDSQTMVDLLIRTQPESNDEMFTLDVVSLYTSIPLDICIKVIESITNGNPLQPALLLGLRIVLFNNFFTFDGRIYKQIKGIAMGTPVAVAVATLYIGFYEYNILQTFAVNIRIYKRYLDDLFICWKNIPGKNFEFQRFKAILHRIPGLKWTQEQQGCKVSFLDLDISLEKDKFKTSTYQKELNLFLYTARHSAHPPGALKGLVKGILLKYFKQNTDRKDFFKLVKLFAERLQARGYSENMLKTTFKEVLTELKNRIPNQVSMNTYPKVFFKIRYDPNGPLKEKLKEIIDVKYINELLSCGENASPIAKVIICYTKARNLGNMLIKY